MSTVPGFWDFRYLSEAIQAMPGQPKLLQQTMFRNRNSNPTTFIEFHTEKYKNKVVPYTTSIAGGTIIDGTRKSATIMKCPKLRPKMQLDPEQLISRPAGFVQYIVGGQSPEQAAEKNLATALANIRYRLDMTIEKACADILQGSMTVPELGLVYDYGMPAGNKITLTGSDLWSDDTADIPAQLGSFCKKAKDQTGHSPNVLLLGTSAAERIVSHPKIQKELDTKRIESGMLAPQFGADFIGTFRGLQLYTYGGSFLDENDVAQEVWPANKIALYSTMAEAVLEFGLIQDLKGGIGGVQGEYFGKIYVEEDPSTMWLLGETNPLPVIKQPASVVTAVVLNG